MILKKINLLIQIFLFTTLSAQETLLFNGDDLDGWKIHGTEKWYVDDGDLICASDLINNMVTYQRKSFIKILNLV